MDEEVYCISDGREGFDDLLMVEGDILFYTLFHCFCILLEQDSAAQLFLMGGRLILLIAVFDAFDVD
jgi:hypothetical protein